MPGTSPTTAQSEHYHLILTLYQSEDHRLLEEPFLTASTGVLTRTGQEFQLEGHIYRAVLSQGLKASTMWSTVGQNVGVVMRWESDTLAPVDIDLSYAVGELARIDEASGGSAIGAWESRLVILTGRVVGYAWGDQYESIEFTLAGAQPQDRGDWYAVGAELTVERFADIANTGERDRAPKCKGTLPPRCWAPVGSSVAVPLPVVVDEVDAVPGVTALQYRRHLIGYEPPAQTTAAEQVRMLSGLASPQFLGAADNASYRVIPAQGTDLLGGVYWYIPGSYVINFGTSTSSTFTNGSSSATLRGFSTTLQDGWQVKGSTGGLDDYLVRLEHSGLTSELGDSTGATVAYTGPDLAGGQGNAIPLPISALDSLYWLPALYGGHRGISQVTDVLIDWLALVDLGYPIETGDLEAMRSRLALFDLTYVRRTRGSPWAKMLEVLEYLPIRVYLYDGRIRFKWRGPVTEQDVVATLDLDTDCGVYRAKPIEWGAEDVFPIVELSHSWNIPDQIYNGKLTLDQTTARAADCWALWRDGLTRPRLQREFDTLETSPGVELAAQWMLYRSGVRAQMMTVDVDATWRWLEPGMAIRVTQTGAVRSDSWWWIEGITFGADGKGELLLEMGA